MAAIETAKKDSKKRNFIQSVEVDVILTLREADLKKPESRINEFVELPNPTGKKVRVGVFATGDMAMRAKSAGADLVLGRTELEKLAGDKKAGRKLAEQADLFVAEAPLMPLVGKALGPFLGPRGKMPTPVPPAAPIEQIVDRYRRTVQIRLREQPHIQCTVGSEDMPSEAIAKNIEAVIARIGSKLPTGMRSIRGVYVKTTMGPRVKVEA